MAAHDLAVSQAHTRTTSVFSSLLLLALTLLACLLAQRAALMRREHDESNPREWDPSIKNMLFHLDTFSGK